MRYFWLAMKPVPSSHSRRPARRRSRTRAQALVEFAVVLPVFLLLLAGILDFGFILYSRMTVINAARDGARIGTTMTDQPLKLKPAVQTQVSAAANGMAVTTNTTCITGTGNPACSFSDKGLHPGDSIKVVVTYDHRTFFPLLFGASIPMSSTVQMVLE
jgi:Flp pilus assembly protein TadG